MIDLDTAAIAAGDMIYDGSARATVPVPTVRYGDVLAVGERTMDVRVVGARLDGLLMMAHCAGASAGDRVRVVTVGAESVVDGILA